MLGVIMDSALRYKQHLARSATKGLQAALALGRLRMISPSTTRQLFTAMVEPVVDYASNVWMHACTAPAMAALNRVQREGGKSITGSFRTVATAVAEAEASIRTVNQRHIDRATKFWMNFRTLPKTHPSSKLSLQTFKRFISPLQKMSQMHQDTPTERMEPIKEYVMAPWEERIPSAIDHDKDRAVQMANCLGDIRIATSASCRSGIVGMGIAICDAPNIEGEPPSTISTTLGTRTEQNPYTTELAAIAKAMHYISPSFSRRQIIIVTSNQAALKAISKPRHQSGQSYLCQIYERFRLLGIQNHRVLMLWVPAGQEFHLGKAAKQAAQRATERGEVPEALPLQAKSTLLNRARRTHQRDQAIPQDVGKYSREMDSALPGQHTRKIYDALNRREASVLAQLRTGMAGLNGYLHRIGATESDQCDCGQAKKSVQHFLFRCTKWDVLRTQMLQQTATRTASLSYFLGGKAKSDPKDWTPDLSAVHATIKYAIATGRLERESEQGAA
jgi:hypothetical protein